MKPQQLDIISTRALIRALPSSRLIAKEVILAALRARQPGVVHRTEILDMLYGGEIDGGAESARNAISVFVLRLRQDGHRIERWHGIGYRLLTEAQWQKAKEASAQRRIARQRPKGTGVSPSTGNAGRYLDTGRTVANDNVPRRVVVNYPKLDPTRSAWITKQRLMAGR